MLILQVTAIVVFGAVLLLLVSIALARLVSKPIARLAAQPTRHKPAFLRWLTNLLRFRELEWLLQPGEVFTWPKGRTITAIDPVIIELPKALFRPDDPMQDVIQGDDDMGIVLPPHSENILLSLKSGMSVTIRRNSEACLFANDIVPRRIRMTFP